VVQDMKTSMKTEKLFDTAMFRALALSLFAGLAAMPGNLGAQGLLNQEERREQRFQEFLLEHSDASGTPRPDLWLKGIQATKRMDVAESITLAPAGAAPGAVQTFN